MEKCNTENQKINMEIHEPETLENRPCDPAILKKVETLMVGQFLQHVAAAIVKNSRKAPGHGSPVTPSPDHAFAHARVLWIDVERALASHNPFNLDVETIEDALLNHPAYVTDGVVKVAGEKDRFVIGVDPFAAGVRLWF